MKFTPNQLALLGAYFTQGNSEFLEEFTLLANAIYEFVGLGDPYDEVLILSFASEVLNFKEAKGGLSDEAMHKYFVLKCEYWAKKA